MVTVPWGQGDLKAVFMKFWGGVPMLVRMVSTSPFWKAMPFLFDVRTLVFWVAQSVVLTRKFRSYASCEAWEA